MYYAIFFSLVRFDSYFTVNYILKCNQFSTIGNGTSTPIEVSASGGYMLSQCALPFASPGHLRGLTVARLFEKVLSLQLPNLFISSFNEFIGGRQAPASAAKIAFNQGLPFDSQRFSVWVDTYAAEFSRDIEPSVEGGNVTWTVTKSCVQLYKAGKTCAEAPMEPCCTRSDKEVFGNIWSLTRLDGTDFLLTQYVNERNTLVASGVWKEICSPISNPTAFCVNLQEQDGRTGPFMLYNVSNVSHPRGLGEAWPTQPLFRCITAQVTHFFSLDPDCEGEKTESILGWVRTNPGLETLRALNRCNVSGVVYHSLDLPCDVGGTLLGYVR